MAHSYPTKIPPEAIVPFIEYYTSPGQVVLDPFAGSGMTGVAALWTGRSALLNDLGVGATHLAYNHCTPCDPAALIEAYRQVSDACAAELAELYRAQCTRCGGPARIIYTLWSEVRKCPDCGGSVVVWESVDRISGRVADRLICPQCHSAAPRRALLAGGPPVPALISYECLAQCKPRRAERQPTAADLDVIEETKTLPGPAGYPNVSLDPQAEMYIRCALHLRGVRTVADFYTARNLRALVAIWRTVQLVKSRRARAALAFAFTNTAWHATKMRRFNARGGQRPLTGTLYIPQLSIEANPGPILGHKIRTLVSFYGDLSRKQKSGNTQVVIRKGCATSLAGLPDASVDYIFTDPPFGSNIFYADLNTVWESWLGEVTDPRQEAVINRSRKNGKSQRDYFTIIKDSFVEMRRVLKPQRWASVVFHNSDGKVWEIFQRAAEEAGFVLSYAGGLDKTKRSMKGYIGLRNGENVADGDVILNFRNTQKARPPLKRPSRRNLEKAIVGVISAHLASLRRRSPRGQDLDQRSLQHVHGLVVRAMLNGRYAPDHLSFAFVRDLCERHFAVRGGRVVLRS